MARDTGNFVVVVGVDGSDDARTAAEWAVREASAHGGRLLVVHAWNVPVIATGPEMSSLIELPFDEIQAAAERLLADEVAHLQELDDSVEITSRLAYGSPITALLEQAADASMIVVGSRGAGRVMGLLLGSVSQAVVTRAECPVLVVPPADGKRA